MLTPERETHWREVAKKNGCPECCGENAEAASELLAEIDRLRAENKQTLEWGLHEGNRVANAAADRHTELVLENDQLREKLAVVVKALEDISDKLFILGPIEPTDREVAEEALAKIGGEK